ncbi:hypothetical protein CFOL_v3_21014 [Cephalotus follicularis]|uniref:Uncharacterized protein n=1 Tax=Cephalotus follicularis TaxID=3775 RepID=A0A1Q3CBT3_CEPFO|nr:hypothetical protein CFOL_v3_21014 [Cephalotus follicularis]
MHICQSTCMYELTMTHATTESAINAPNLLYIHIRNPQLSSNLLTINAFYHHPNKLKYWSSRTSTLTKKYIQGKPTEMNTKTTFILFAILLVITASVSLAARPDSSGPFSAVLKNSRGKPGDQNNKGGGDDAGMGGIFGPGGGDGYGIPGGGGYGIPGWGDGGIGGGYGSGYGGPTGGYSKGGVVRPTTVCKEKGPCYMKKLACPTKCFTSYSSSGKGYGGGGGGGGCTMDCKKKCVAYC